MDFLKEDNRLVLSYIGEQWGSNWIYSELAKGDSVTLRRTFTLTSNELISQEDPEDEDAPVLFEIGTKDGEYFCLSKEVLGIKNDLFIHESLELTSKTFIAERNISIFSKLDKLTGVTIRIGGPEETAIPEAAFSELLQKFPNSYELTRYASARVGAVIFSYISTKEDYEEKYQQYMNRRASIIIRKSKLFLICIFNMPLIV